MTVSICSETEGIAGVVGWEQCRPTGMVKESLNRFAVDSLHPQGARELTLKEARLAVGALADRPARPARAAGQPGSCGVVVLSRYSAGAVTSSR